MFEQPSKLEDMAEEQKQEEMDGADAEMHNVYGSDKETQAKRNRKKPSAQ